MAMMKRLMIPAASSRLTPGTEYSRAKRDKVMVSRDAIKIMGLVVPAAIVKLIAANSTRLGIKSGIQIRKNVLSHPAPETRAASSISAPT